MKDGRAAARALARTVLYEGYVLYPYGATSLKNRTRASFGELLSGARLRAELPISSRSSHIDVEVAFLQPVERIVFDREGHQTPQIDVGDRRLVSFSEGREVRDRGVIRPCRLDDGVTMSVRGAALAEETEITAPDGRARVSRVAKTIDCEVRFFWKEPRDCVVEGFRILVVEIENVSADESALAAVHSPHVLLTSADAPFVSTIDPPASLAKMVDCCESEGLWPILAGSPGDRSVVLLSPIILYDHPALAPESPGDLFDATENDELLILSIMSLSDDERRTMAATDPRAADILARVDALGGRLGELHGAPRSPGAGGGKGAGSAAARVGDGVILRPLGRESLDASLAGKKARIVEAVVEVSGREHLVVVVDDDPGRDLGHAGLGVGHRFFVSRDEVELITGAVREEAR